MAGKTILLAEAAELIQYKSANDVTIGVRTKYNTKFLQAFKALIPVKERAWDQDKKEWVVAGKHLDNLVSLVKEYFGPPMMTVQKTSGGNNPLTAKNAIILHTSPKWIWIQTPYDKGFLTDLKDFFDDKKWVAASKQWKVPYSKENLKMASYLIKRHYKKAPEINRVYG